MTKHKNKFDKSEVSLTTLHTESFLIYCHMCCGV